MNNLVTMQQRNLERIMQGKNLIDSSCTDPSMDLPQGPNDSPDIVLGGRIALNRLNEMASKGCSKSDCFITLQSVTDGILNQELGGDPWENISDPDTTGREFITSGKEERRKNYINKIAMTQTAGEDQESFICSSKHCDIGQEGTVNACMGVESGRVTGMMMMGLVPNFYYYCVLL